MKLHIIWDKEQIRYSSYLLKYATHTFLIPNIMFNKLKMLPLTLQSEIGTSDNTLIKGNKEVSKNVRAR